MQTDALNYLLLSGIGIIIIGFALKLDSIAVIIVSAIVTSLIAKMPFVDILTLLGESFVKSRYMSLFFLILPVIGVCERFGLREQAVKQIKKLTLITAGRLLWLYQLIRVVSGALSLRIGGHPQFVRPLVEPMAQGAASAGANLDAQLVDEIKGASAAAENYGNFFGQNLFFASSGTLLILGTLTEQGYDITGHTIAFWTIPIAASSLLVSAVQYYLLDRKIKGATNRMEGK